MTEMTKLLTHFLYWANIEGKKNASICYLSKNSTSVLWLGLKKKSRNLYFLLPSRMMTLMGGFFFRIKEEGNNRNELNIKKPLSILELRKREIRNTKHKMSDQ